MHTFTHAYVYINSSIDLARAQASAFAALPIALARNPFVIHCGHGLHGFARLGLPANCTTLTTQGYLRSAFSRAILMRLVRQCPKNLQSAHLTIGSVYCATRCDRVRGQAAMTRSCPGTSRRNTQGTEAVSQRANFSLS